MNNLISNSMLRTRNHSKHQGRLGGKPTHESHDDLFTGKLPLTSYPRRLLCVVLHLYSYAGTVDAPLEMSDAFDAALALTGRLGARLAAYQSHVNVGVHKYVAGLEDLRAMTARLDAIASEEPEFETLLPPQPSQLPDPHFYPEESTSSAIKQPPVAVTKRAEPVLESTRFNPSQASLGAETAHGEPTSVPPASMNVTHGKDVVGKPGPRDRMRLLDLHSERLVIPDSLPPASPTITNGNVRHDVADVIDIDEPYREREDPVLQAAIADVEVVSGPVPADSPAPPPIVDIYNAPNMSLDVCESLPIHPAVKSASIDVALRLPPRSPPTPKPYPPPQPPSVHQYATAYTQTTSPSTVSSEAINQRAASLFSDHASSEPDEDLSRYQPYDRLDFASNRSAGGHMGYVTHSVPSTWSPPHHAREHSANTCREKPRRDPYFHLPMQCGVIAALRDALGPKPSSRKAVQPPIFRKR